MGTLTESLSGMLLLPLVVSILLAGLAQSNENYEENGMEYNLPVALESTEEEGILQRGQVWNRNVGGGGKGKAGRNGKAGGGGKDKRKRMARKNGRRVQNKSGRGRGQRWGKRRSWRRRNGKGKRQGRTKTDRF